MICDVVSILSHLVRTSPEHLILVMLILQGTKGNFLNDVMSFSMYISCVSETSLVVPVFKIILFTDTPQSQSDRMRTEKLKCKIRHELRMLKFSKLVIL